MEDKWNKTTNIKPTNYINQAITRSTNTENKKAQLSLG